MCDAWKLDRMDSRWSAGGLCLSVAVEADDDVEIIDAEVSVESQLSTYLELQMQLFRSVLADTTGHHHKDTADSRDLVNRFCTLQDRQMKIIRAIQASRYTAQQVHPAF